uniref:LD28384p n=1 Tax=Drosophila melanogaster TaxID=7227 RepID=Q8MSV8_DROME|nr:LD28384p [Drosophila melanogaster]
MHNFNAPEWRNKKRKTGKKKQTATQVSKSLLPDMSKLSRCSCQSNRIRIRNTADQVKIYLQFITILFGCLIGRWSVFIRVELVGV